MRRILHITRMNFLSDKAHVYTTTKTCEAFSMQEGVQVALLSTDDSLRDPAARDVFFKKHDVKSRFEIVSLKSVANRLKKSTFRPVNWLETLAVNFSIAHYIIRKRKEFDILYVRDCSLALPIFISRHAFRKPLFVEIHAVLHKRYRQMLNDFFSRQADGLVAISHGLKEYYLKINPNIIVAFCAAAEPERFARIKETKDQLRDELHLPKYKTILMYSGNLWKTGNYDSYGIEDIVAAMAKTSDDTVFVGVGKKGNETAEHEALARSLGIEKKIIFLPWVTKQEVYRYWKAADILLIPAAGAQIGNSPTKMFEYLVSGKPIIAAGTAPVKEVLHHNEDAILINDYKDPNEWAAAVEKIRTDETFKKKIIDGAMRDSALYTWPKRGSDIVQFMSESLSK